MTHAEMDDLYELYVLDALETELASEIDAHVTENCEHCLHAINRALDTTAGLSGLADPVTPPAIVRKRLIASVTARTARRRFAFAVPILAAACLALLGFALWAITGRQSTQAQLRTVTYERNQLRTMVAILARPQTRTIQFGTSDQVTHGRVLLGPNGGLVVVGSQMPSIAEDKAFELWLIPAEGNPIPAGVFRSNPAGEFVHVAPQPVNPSKVAAVAVTVEPKSGSPAPTSKPFLVIKVG